MEKRVMQVLYLHQAILLYSLFLYENYMNMESN